MLTYIYSAHAPCVIARLLVSTGFRCVPVRRFSFRLLCRDAQLLFTRRNVQHRWAHVHTIALCMRFRHVRTL